MLIVHRVAALALLVLLRAPRRTPLLWLPTGLLLGGALGNLDRPRCAHGAVTDFVELPPGRRSTSPTCAITVGVLALLSCSSAVRRAHAD